MWIPLLLIASLAPPAATELRWGADGHSIVCEIAFLDLHPNTRAKVQAIIATDPSFQRFSDSCSWADLVRGQVRAGAAEFQRFARLNDAHFVNFARGAGTLDQTTCTRDQGGARVPCVIDAIREFSGALRAGGPALQRLEALKFLAHFVGDIHQPLHAGYAEDLGGNNVNVVIPSGSRRNLHSVWDSELIAMAARPWRDYAAELHGAISPIDRTLWTGLDPFTWAAESYAIVEDQVYENLRTGENGDRILDRDYWLLNRLTVERRLEQAGFRLARVLEASLGTNP